MHLAMAVGFANHGVCDELEFCDGDFTSTKWECTLLAGMILYGLLKRIRTSRALEEALQVRLDFRWLAQGRSIDPVSYTHLTLPTICSV